MIIIDRNSLDRLSRAAAESPRRRKNLNLHADYADPCQRLFNALEPGTYIRPHRHVEPPKPECFLAVRGRFALLLFAGDGTLEKVLVLGDGSDALAAELPPGIWHSLVALEPGSIFFETKPGPYTPLSDKDFAPWAPDEGSPEAGAYLAKLLDQVVRSCCP